MEVILLEDVKSLGKKGELVKINDGYARNYILPKKLGIEATAKNMNDLKLKRQNEERIEKKKLDVDEYLESLLDKHGRSLRAIYDYVHDGFTFRSTVKTDVTTMACRILNTGSGSCWDYAALTSLLLKKAGYNCQIIVGVGAIASEHNWVIVEVESGVWRHMDTQHTKETFLLTDEELEARNGKSPYVNYEWDKSKYPKAE